jgi:hypothetical protein
MAHICSVNVNGNVYMISVNGRSLSFDSQLARKRGITMPQLEAMCKVTDAASEGTVELSRDEMVYLVEIRKKQPEHMLTSAVQAPIAPAVQAPIAPAVQAPIAPAVQAPIAPAVQASVVSSMMNNTSATVEYGIENRVSGKGTSREEYRISQLENAIAKIQNEELFLLQYDIPEELNTEVKNPSCLLWNFGFRLTLSCWVLPQNSLNQKRIIDLFNFWANYPKVKKHIFPFSEKASRDICALAQEKLREEICIVHTSLINRIASISNIYETARKLLDERVTNGEQVGERQYSNLESKKNGEIRAKLKETAQDLQGLINCAKIFDDSMETQDLFNALRQLIRAEQSAFNLEMENKGRKISDVRIP